MKKLTPDEKDFIIFTVFLKELTELTKRHGFSIGGCGHCGSPWVTKITDDEKKESKYYVDECNEDLSFGIKCNQCERITLSTDMRGNICYICEGRKK